jgi:hypothetical protein
MYIKSERDSHRIKLCMCTYLHICFNSLNIQELPQPVVESIRYLFYIHICIYICICINKHKHKCMYLYICLLKLFSTLHL